MITYCNDSFKILKHLISLPNKRTKPVYDSNLFIKSKPMILLMTGDSLINFNCRYKVSFLIPKPIAPGPICFTIFDLAVVWFPNSWISFAEAKFYCLFKEWSIPFLPLQYFQPTASLWILLTPGISISDFLVPFSWTFKLLVAHLWVLFLKMNMDFKKESLFPQG